jgi:hypothetical protein
MPSIFVRFPLGARSIVAPSSVENYDIIATSESFTAENDDSTAEDFTLAETPEAISYVTVNGATCAVTTCYTASGATISLLAASSDADDTVVIGYTYEYDMPSAIDGMVSIILIIFVIAIVAGGAAYIKFSN